MAEGGLETVLTRDDAENVFLELYPARNHSYELGLRLKLPDDVVEVIHTAGVGGAEQLRGVVVEALNRSSTLTWRDFIEALRRSNLRSMANSLQAFHYSTEAAVASTAVNLMSSGDTLTPADAGNILEELLEAQSYSFKFGVMLNLPVDEVEAICARYSDPRDRLLHIIIAFLRRAEPRPTWRVIVGALRSPVVNLTALARRVEAAHFPEAARDVVPETTDTEPAVNDTAMTPTEQHSALAERVEAAHFPDLTATRPPPPATGPSSPDCIPPQALPVDSATATSSEAVKKTIEELKTRFRAVKDNTKESLVKRRVPVDQVADSLTLLSPDDDDHHKMFTESHVSDLYHAANVAELFGMMDFHWNYLDPSLLDHLVRDFNLEEVKGQMETYKSDLGQFRKKTPLTLFCRAQRRKRVRPSPDFREVVAEFDWPNDVTLEVVEQFRQEYASHYGLHECAMMVAQVRPG